MHCEYCRYAPPIGAEGEQDECGFFEKYGTTWKDGEYGCTLHPKTLKKFDEEYTEHLGNMGTDMGLEMDFEMKHLDLDKTIEHCKHVVGLDNHPRIYHRHGKAYYRAYRNGWSNGAKPKEDFEVLCRAGLMSSHLSQSKWYVYHLTPAGLAWLGRRVKMIIRESE